MSKLTLDNMAPALLALVLCAIDSPRDAYSLIAASSAFYRVFASSRERILSAVLKNAILPAALPSALASIYVADIPEGQTEHLDSFLDSYFAGSTAFPTEMARITDLSRLHLHASRFIDDYSSRALRALGPGLDLQPPTCTERARFQRAFYRFELYSRINPVDYAVHGHSVLPAEAQFTKFLARMEPWEVEEMSCVHQYFSTLIEGFVDDLENHLVEAVLGAPGVRLPPSGRISPDHASSRGIENATRSGSVDDSTTQRASQPVSAGPAYLVAFRKWDVRGLGLFSNYGRFRSPRYIGYLASLGVRFFDALATATQEERTDLIRANSPAWCDFLPQALEAAPGDGPKTVQPADLDDQPSHANLGYYLYKPSDREVYIGIVNDGALDVSNCPLRQLGFVFWDAARISMPAVAAQLRNAQRMDHAEANALFNRSARESAEDRLMGVMIPAIEMEKIVDEFESVLSSW